jgi:hypothetical protein
MDSRLSVSSSPTSDDSENSNPQQGTTTSFTTTIHGNMKSSAGTSLDKSFPVLSVNVAPSRAEGPPSDAQPPQSFAPTSSRRPGGRMSIKIPPTSKDSRKLFVGGLPMDGTYMSLCLRFRGMYAHDMCVSAALVGVLGFFTNRVFSPIGFLCLSSFSLMQSHRTSF